MSKHDKDGPTVDELREDNRWSGIIRLGRLALWNHLNKRVVEGRTDTLGLIKTYEPELFDRTVNSPRPIPFTGTL